MKNIFSKNKMIFFITTIISLVLIFTLVSDYFCHGFFSNPIKLNQIDESSLKYVDLNDEGYTLKFKPQAKHFAGFEVILSNLEENIKGNIVLEVINNKGKIIDTIIEEISSIKNLEYYKFYTNVDLNKNEVYKLHIYTKDCKSEPKLILVEDNNLTLEQIDNDLLIGYAYSYSTFNYAERILFILIIINIWMFISINLFGNETLKKKGKFLFLIISLILLLAWNYSFNTFDSSNLTFDTFQNDSESLVTSVIHNQKSNIGFDKYGLYIYDEFSKDLRPYISQYGLQGKVIGLMSLITNYNIPIPVFNVICSLLAATVFVLIVLLISKKYNKLLGFIFYSVFLLSPWIVNFARNLYWVEFTWFLPVLIGLFCSIYIDKKSFRIASYIGVFISILIKCLCGYEYISTIMMGSISFLLADMVQALIKKDKEKFKLIFKTTFIIGISALLGFIFAISIHAILRGSGNVLLGIKAIIEEDVLRRTNNSNLNTMADMFWPSLNASIWEVFCMYFHFNTNIIPLVTSNLFPLLCLIPIVILIYNYKNKTIDYNDASLYVIFFLTSVSWFILAKSHSYIHTHMNYVLWYFGYIQICFYIIIKQVMDFIAINKKDNVIKH